MTKDTTNSPRNREAPLALREQQKQLTRERLITSASEQFSNRGYVDTTIDDIAQGAGASRATFYLHFSAKWEVADEVWAAVRTELVDLFVQLGQQPELTRGWIGDWLDKTFDFYRRHRSVLIAIHEAIAIEPPLAERFNDRVTEVEGHMIDRIERVRGATRGEAHARASLLVIQHERFCHFWILRNIEFDHSTIRSVLSELWCRELCADPDPLPSADGGNGR